jgi:hypothetical protein
MKNDTQILLSFINKKSISEEYIYAQKNIIGMREHIKRIVKENDALSRKIELMKIWIVGLTTIAVIGWLGIIFDAFFGGMVK